MNDLSEEQIIFLKNYLVSAVRNMALNESLESYGFIETIFSNPTFHQRLSLEDMRQLSSSLRLVRLPKAHADIKPLIERLDRTVEEAT